jgi:hypothetical protein
MARSAEEADARAKQLSDLYSMEAQLHRLYVSSAAKGSREHAVLALSEVLDAIRELGGSPQCKGDPVQARLTQTLVNAQTLREMIAANAAAVGSLDATIAGQQQLVDAAGGPASKMSEALAAETSGASLALTKMNEALDQSLAAFQAAASAEARASERLEIQAKLARDKPPPPTEGQTPTRSAKKKVTIVAVTPQRRTKTSATPTTPHPGKASAMSVLAGLATPPSLPPTPPPPPPLVASSATADKIGDTKLDLGGIKQAALRRDIEKQANASRSSFQEPVTNSRGALLGDIQKAARSRSPERGSE